MCGSNVEILKIKQVYLKFDILSAMTKAKRYEITEKDIDTVLTILKQVDPEHATPDMAITILEHFQAKFHIMAHEDPEKLEKLLKELIEEKNLKTN